MVYGSSNVIVTGQAAPRNNGEPGSYGPGGRFPLGHRSGGSALPLAPCYGLPSHPNREGPWNPAGG